MRVLFFGSCPLPVEKGVPAQGPGIRTWQLVKPVCDFGHTVCAVLLRTEGLYQGLTNDSVTSTPCKNLTIYSMSYEAFSDKERVRKIAEEFKPDAVVGAASVLPNFMACRMADLAPLWADCFGDPIAEIQAKAEIYGPERCAEELFAVWKYYRSVLSRADQFSTLSDAQNHALVGQLALLGRLGCESSGFPFVYTIPCGVEENLPHLPHLQPSSEPFLRGKKFPANAFVVCFSGSYNTWMDADYLFEALEESMKRIPKLYFLSIGGGTKGYNEKIYDDFCAKTTASPHKDRYILCGWVPFQDVPRYYAQSDVGINIDRFTYEGVLGSRNRILQFLAHGLPVVTTPLSEISIQLAKRGLVYCFRMKNEKGCTFVTEPLPLLLQNLSADPEKLKQTGRLGQKVILEEYNYTRTAAPILDWLVAPSRSPDNIARMKSGSSVPVYLNEIERVMDFETRQDMIDFLSGEKAQLDALRKNPLYRLFKSFKKHLVL